MENALISAMIEIELIIIIFCSIEQYDAMGCLKNLVHKKYHRLLLNGLPNFQILLGKNTNDCSKTNNNASAKILNGPVLSREMNESDMTVIASISDSFVVTQADFNVNFNSFQFSGFNADIKQHHFG